jgi:hypothetical protein
MRHALVLGLALAASGCGPILYSEMLAESIRSFSGRMKNTPETKLWITGPNDNVCDSGCFQGGCAGKDKGNALGGLFSKPAGAGGPYDQLAYQVFANWFTQRKKARVVETHRHNYATELNVETHKKIEIAHEGQKMQTLSCEDLCLLDEAKKRKADKVLAYNILDMKGNEMTIHFRLSDVQSGVVEISQTLHVVDMQAIDASFGSGLSPGGGARRPRAEPAD